MEAASRAETERQRAQEEAARQVAEERWEALQAEEAERKRLGAEERRREEEAAEEAEQEMVENIVNRTFVTRSKAKLALDVKVILTPPCIFH